MVWSQPVKASISLTIDVGVVFSVGIVDCQSVAHMVMAHSWEESSAQDAILH